MRLWKLVIPFLCFGVHALEIRPESGAITFTMVDLLSKSKIESLSFKRFYNSASSQDGWFGHSFSSNFETRLQKEADGTLTAFEFGQVPGNVYSPVSTPVKTDELIEEIIKKKKEFVGTAMESFRRKLRTDREFLRITAEELKLHGTPVEGETFRSGIFGSNFISFTKNTYVRELSDGKIETFDKSGRLIKIYIPGKEQKIALSYGREGKLTEVSDNHQNRIMIEWGSDGHISKLNNGSNGKSALYRYEKDKLKAVANELGQTYEYSYDQYGLLTKLSHLNNTTEITYDPKMRTPIELKTSSGITEKWFFDLKITNEGELRMARRELITADRTSKKSWETLVVPGTKVPRQMKTSNYQGDILTRYRSCCYPQPEYIVTPSFRVNFSYDSQNRLIEKRYEGFHAIRFQYDPGGRLSVVANDERELKCEYKQAAMIPVAYSGNGFRLSQLERKKLKDSFRIQWDGEKALHHAEYFRNTSGQVREVKFDEQLIVENGIADTEKKKMIFLKLEKALLHMNLLGEVNYEY